jgi:hypothetical protein
MSRSGSFALLAGASFLAVAACAPAAETNVSLVGRTVDNFLLVDQTGMAHTLKYNFKAPAIVLVSQANGDEASRSAAKTLAALKETYPAVEFLMINSSLADDRASIAAEALSQSFAVPVLDDDYQIIGDSLGFTRTAEALIIDPRTWTVAYHGAVDSAFAQKTSEGYLSEALAQIASGQAVASAHVPVKGAALDFPDRARSAEFATISYADDVAPILMAKCVDCHQPGGIGPFHMTSYEVVKGFAPMIREAIRTDRMPPYDVDRHIGRFQNNENLSEEETKTLIRWIEAGAARGEGEDPLAAGVTQRPDWPLGEPDLVVEIPAYDIPASGVVDYQLPTIDNPLTEGKWLAATTFKAGERQGVHHILAGWSPQKAKDVKGFDWSVAMGGYAVGSESNPSPEGWGTYIPAGGSMSFQMHYTPFGKAATDKSKVGFYFLDADPDLVMRQVVLLDPSITIAPNARRHHERAHVQFPAAVQIYAAQPHAHYRGYASKLTAVFPDGREEVILNMPKYDFNWQREYIYQELIDLPAGTKLVADYWYDNSDLNRANPDPSKEVVWGDQSFEEMLFTAVRYRWADETAKSRRDDLQNQLNASQFFTALDDNLSGRIEEAEFRGPSLAPMKAAFSVMDANKDGGVDAAEFIAAQQAMARNSGAGGQR